MTDFEVGSNPNLSDIGAVSSMTALTWFVGYPPLDCVAEASVITAIQSTGAQLITGCRAPTP